MAQNTVQQIRVSTYEQAQFELTRLTMQGFRPADDVRPSSGASITMVRSPKINVAGLILGLFMWLVPGLIYLMIHSARGDEIVEIFVGEKELTGATAAEVPVPMPSLPPTVLLSPDRDLWWDGQAWRDLQDSVPPDAPRGADGTWWDGVAWRPLPQRSA